MMTQNKSTYVEPAKEIRVVKKTDVIVVGGGPGGVASAVCAARNGARTVLIERYGHLGGMATGGLVNIFPNLSDISGKQHIFGLNKELIARLDQRGGTTYPPKSDWGSDDKTVVDYYHDAKLGWFYLKKDFNSGTERVIYTAVVDPEILKDELNDMVLESGADLYLHSWGCRPIVENNTVTGVIFESKSGRQANLGQVIIDSTGDGDMFVRAGAAFDDKLNPKLRTAMLANVFWFCNVDLAKYDLFKRTHSDEYKELMAELQRKGGHPSLFKGILRNQKNSVWFHAFQPRPDGKASDAMDVEELTRVDISARKQATTTFDFFRKHIPGFEESYIMLTASQLGTQGGRRVIGEYVLSEADTISDEIFEDTIAVLANNDSGRSSVEHPSLCIPYRCLVPQKLDGLLVACRAFSSSDEINHKFNIIPHCICYGQAAGTAAAIAAKAGIQPRNVDYKSLQKNLTHQGVNIPQGQGV